MQAFIAAGRAPGPLQSPGRCPEVGAIPGGGKTRKPKPEIRRKAEPESRPSSREAPFAFRPSVWAGPGRLESSPERRRAVPFWARDRLGRGREVSLTTRSAGTRIGHPRSCQGLAGRGGLDTRLLPLNDTRNSRVRWGTRTGRAGAPALPVFPCGAIFVAIVTFFAPCGPYASCFPRRGNGPVRSGRGQAVGP